MIRFNILNKNDPRGVRSKSVEVITDSTLVVFENINPIISNNMDLL